MSTIRDILTKLITAIDEETAKRLEKILANTPDYTTATVQAAVIAAQAEEIKRLKQENERLQKAHDHQYSMAWQMLREAERNGAERDALKQEASDKHNALIRFQDIARATDRALVSITEKVHPDIEAIHDGCIKIHLRQVLNLINPEAKLDAALGPDKLCIDACLEANRARGLFPNPNYLTLALAEEAGEVTKAVLDHKQGKCDLAAVRKEIVQTMAMCLRLATEGDPTVDLTWSQS